MQEFKNKKKYRMYLTNRPVEAQVLPRFQFEGKTDV